MRNVTITLDEKTASWVREHAARHGMSVSRFVGDVLHERMCGSREYDQAMRRYLGKQPVVLKRTADKYATREEVHDRARLR